MQVNSAQDYLTLRKRQIIAKTYYSTPPPQEQKSNTVYLSTVANNATQRQRFVIPTVSAWGGVAGGSTYSSLCTGCSSNAGAPGVFTTVNTKDTHNTRLLPMSIHSGIVG
jgi:hypothetical protein